MQNYDLFKVSTAYCELFILIPMLKIELSRTTKPKQFQISVKSLMGEPIISRLVDWNQVFLYNLCVASTGLAGVQWNNTHCYYVANQAA